MKRMSFEQVLEKASDGFFEVIVKNYPEAESGDFAPDISYEWNRVIYKAAKHWLWSNHPQIGAALNRELEFVYHPKPEDEELNCDWCGANITQGACWSAVAPGYGSSGVLVLCNHCYVSNFR
jgi:hypothetical protein